MFIINKGKVCTSTSIGPRGSGKGLGFGKSYRVSE
jgi:hypothetical protein